jgi:hypothetical protein
VDNVDKFLNNPQDEAPFLELKSIYGDDCDALGIMIDRVLELIGYDTKEERRSLIIGHEYYAPYLRRYNYEEALVFAKEKFPKFIFDSSWTTLEPSDYESMSEAQVNAKKNLVNQRRMYYLKHLQEKYNPAMSYKRLRERLEYSSDTSQDGIEDIHKYALALGRPNHLKVRNIIRKENNKTKKSLSKKITREFRVGAAVRESSHLVILDFDATDPNETSLPSLHFLKTAVKVLGLKDYQGIVSCQDKPCYPKALSDPNRGYRLMFYTQFPWAKENLEIFISKMKEELDFDNLGIKRFPIDVFYRGHTTATRYLTEGDYKSVGWLKVNPDPSFQDIHLTEGDVGTWFAFPEESIPFEELFKSDFETLKAQVALLKNTEARTDFGRTKRKYEPEASPIIMDRITRKSFVRHKPKTDSEIIATHPISNGKRFKAQLQICRECILNGGNLEDFKNLVIAANDGTSKDIAAWSSAKFHKEMEKIYQYQLNGLKDFIPKTLEWQTDHLKTTRNLNTEWADMIYAAFVKERFHKNSPIPESVFKKSFYTAITIMLKDTEYYYRIRGRSYLNNLAPLSKAKSVAEGNEKLKKHAETFDVPFHTLKKMFNILCDIGLFKPITDADGRYFRWGTFTKHYYLVPLHTFLNEHFPDLNLPVAALDVLEEHFTSYDSPSNPLLNLHEENSLDFSFFSEEPTGDNGVINLNSYSFVSLFPQEVERVVWDDGGG